MSDYRSWRNARYHCDICRRPFDRRDVLARHMHVHGRQRAPPKARRRACVSCSQSKIRCDGQHPACASCQRRHRDCVWAEPPASGAAASSATFDDMGFLDASFLPAESPNTCVPSGKDPLTLTPASYAEPSQRDEFSGLTHPPPPALQHPPASTSSLSSMHNASIPDLALSAWQGIDFTSDMDWFWTANASDDMLAASDTFGAVTGPDLYNSHLSLMSAPQTTSNSAKQSVVGDDVPQDDVDGSGPAFHGLLTPQPQASSGYGGLWPPIPPGPPSSRLSLPALESDNWEPGLNDQFNAIMTINDRTWHALQRCLHLPYEHNPLQTLDLSNFPTADKLDHCIDMYFTHFHPMLAIIHQPTFDPGRDLLVTLAVINIGACYTDFDESSSFSAALSDLIRRLLVFTAEQDHRFVRSAPYLMAHLLQGVRLFDYDNHHPARTPESTEDTWQQWITAEMLRRLGWAVYKYDASVSYLHNNRPFLTIGDINLPLPGSAEHWAASTAVAWASLHPSRKTLPPGPRLVPTIKLLFDENTDPLIKIVDEEHLFLVTLTLLRMLWSEKEIGVHDLLKESMHDDARHILLRAIDRLAVPVSTLADTHTDPEMARLVHRMQLIHLAHIYGAGDLMNWLYPYLRNGPGADNAKVRMHQWARENPQRVREVAYHSAQILGLVRDYPDNLPLHGFVIFHAGVVLVCMSIVLPRRVSSNRGASLQLDDSAAMPLDTPSRQRRWVAAGGDEQVGLVGVASLCCADGRRRVLDQTAALLKRQRSWGMARNLTKLVLSLRSRDAVTGQHDSSPLT